MESHTNEPRPRSSDARAEGPVGASPRVRCILALPESAPHTPADLREAFSARNLEVRELVGAFQAMGALMDLERDAGVAVALVVVEPTLFPRGRSGELLIAAGRWRPQAARWVYERSSTPRLSKWIEPTETPAAEVAKVNGIRGALRDVAGAPTLRLAGEGDPAGPRPPASSDELTEEELSMLLGREIPAPPSDRPGANRDER